MVNTNWYRKTSWTADDQKDFFGRLQKARPHNRSQYLHIQASHLMETGIKANILTALSLLDIAIIDYPEPINLELDYFLKAKCYESLGKFDDAIVAYRHACEARRNQLSMRTEAPLYYAYFVVSHNRIDLYNEVLTVVEELVHEIDVLFPIQKYLLTASMALIHDKYGQKEIAKKFAEGALDAVAQTESGLSYHPRIGLVTIKDKDVIKRLKKIRDS